MITYIILGGLFIGFLILVSWVIASTARIKDKEDYEKDVREDFWTKDVDHLLDPKKRK